MTAADETENAGTSRTSRGKLISSSISNLLSYVVYLPVTLVINAYMLHRIGIEAYGIWATLTTIAGFGQLLDFGVATPLIKFVAESLAVEGEDEVNVLLNTAMVAYAAFAAIFVIVMLLLSSWILLHIFHASSGDASLHRLFAAIVVGFAISLVFSVLQSLIFGLQRSELMARLTLAYNLLAAAGFAIALFLGLGVNGLVVVWVANVGIVVVVNYLLARRLFPRLRINPFLFDYGQLKRIFGFSLRVQVTNVAMQMNDQLDRTLIAYVLGPVLLGAYSLGARAAQALRGVTYALTLGLLPAIADLKATGDEARLRFLYLRSTRYLASVDLPLCVGAMVLAHPLIFAWLGPGHSRIAITMGVILLAYGIGLPSQVTDQALNGIGRPDIRMRADLALLPFHLTVCIFLIWRFGFYGTVAGTAFTYSLNRLYLYWAGSRAIGVGALEFAREGFLQPILGACLAALVAIGIQFTSGGGSIAMLLLELAAFAAVYLIYLALFGLDAYDRSLVRSYLGPAVSRLPLLKALAGTR